uniref:Uncharacterized protein n=1 Tax=Anguilla anguilla TaxID=7936 RepID=A0A0E9UX20_ANGAN
MWLPKNLKLETLSTSSPLMYRGERSSQCLLKSMMSSFSFFGVQ